jgi:hypothetical protein
MAGSESRSQSGHAADFNTTVSLSGLLPQNAASSSSPFDRQRSEFLATHAMSLFPKIDLSRRSGSPFAGE